MAKFHGVGVNFGVNSALGAITGVFQTRDHNNPASNESIMDGLGNFVQDSTYGLHETATFEYVATGASGATVTVTVPTVGELLTVTDTVYPAIAGTNWIVRSFDVKGSNTTATRVTVNLWRAAAITS
jgi:hypothetical protein